MADHETDESVIEKIQKLEHERQVLYDGGDPDNHAQARIEKIQVELDQYWDLLRQRRALREFGKDPDRAKVRPPDIVENYEQ